MKTWIMVVEITDDGVEDPDEEVKGKYFTKKELLKEFKGFETAGLTIDVLSLDEKI